MRELSLFSGVGGGLLGTYLLGWKPIGYVEFNDYCQRVIAQRIADGILPNAPIFGDVRTFISEGYAASYTGLVDVVTGGFPCQPFSIAGERRGADDERNMWPATAECVRIVRPRCCFFENVVGLLSSGYFGVIVADLAALGYGVRWGVLSACAYGAPHPRKRVFIVAYADGAGRGQQCGREQHEKNGDPQRDVHFWSRTPEPTRVAHGVVHRMDRLRACGNGQVPAVVRAAWHLLTEGL